MLLLLLLLLVKGIILIRKGRAVCMLYRRPVKSIGLLPKAHCSSTTLAERVNLTSRARRPVSVPLA